MTVKPKTRQADTDDYIEIWGAREHNLQNVDIKIPRNSLVVITGLSGSGKSSLAFDTLYAEGQRRYIETFSAYARQFLGNMERPDVDKINGLSPVIAIEQKTTSKNPRSTVGTITEIYDFLRLLFARASHAFSYETGERMVSYTEEQIQKLIWDNFSGQRIHILAPLVRSRKGHYRELFQQITRQGFVKVRVDGEVQDIKFGMRLDRYKTHDIEVVVDRMKLDDNQEKRLKESLTVALQQGGGTALILAEEQDKPRFFSKNLMCPTTGISYPLPEPNTFSFNSPKGACPHCNGLGEVREVQVNKIIPDPTKSLARGALAPIGELKKTWIFDQLKLIAARYKFELKTPWKDIPPEAQETILKGSSESFSVKNDYVGITRKYQIKFEGVINFIESQANESKSKSIHRWADSFMDKVPCPACQGQRLKVEALHFKLQGKNISELAQMSIASLKVWLDELYQNLDERQQQIAQEIIKELQTRVSFLLDVGLEYLNLNRPARSLSGGEAQRIRLATQIGSQLVNVLYILDEPSIGLHQRDNHKLIQSLHELRDLGNSVIVVEHDRDMMEEADHIIDMGPYAGKRGGHVVAQGTIGDIASSQSLTAQYLRGDLKIALPDKRRKGNGKNISLRGATGHNLQNVNVKIPLGTLTVVTGVSGSGKSSLINETLYPAISAHFYNSVKAPLPYQRLSGMKYIDKVIDIDQSPIGRTPRSNPATYTGLLSPIRELFANLPESKVRGYKPGRFSFNVKEGRCPTCEGGGIRVIEMNLLPDVYIPCETCRGKRFNRETLEIRYRGKSIADVLDMSVNQATEFFEHIPKIYQKVKTIQDVGLGYINLGQQSTTLSGGEAQRVKLATELSKRDTGKTLYILDEPTTGLHFEDIRVLMDVLQKLVDRGNTVLVIEHNMDVIKLADHVIDLGPEGGEKGGRIIFEGLPEKLAKQENSHTGRYLQHELN